MIDDNSIVNHNTNSIISNNNTNSVISNNNTNSFTSNSNTSSIISDRDDDIKINTDEMNILFDIVKHWGKLNVIEFINNRLQQNKIQLNKVNTNDDGNTYSICYINFMPQPIDFLTHDEYDKGNLRPALPEMFRKPVDVTYYNPSDKLNGTIPSLIGSLTNLRYINLSCNQLNGSIPSSIGNLINLQVLDLRNNFFTGFLPWSIGGLCSLKYFNLYNNQLSGLIPSSIGSLVNLEFLDLDDNQFSGPIPSSIGDLLNLKDLCLGGYGNNLSGSVPTSIGKLVNLKYLNLSGNKELSGALPVMSSNVVINSIGTKIVQVEVRTVPLSHWYDYLFIIVSVVLGYIDMVSNILAIMTLSGNTPITITNIVFLVLSLMLGVWNSEDTISALRVIFQVDQLYQAYEAITSHHETVDMVVSKKIDAIFRTVPSAIIQLYGFLHSLHDNESSILDRFLSPSQILLLSVAISITQTGYILAYLSPNIGPVTFSKSFIIHFIYYTIEILSRVIIIEIMFFSLSGYILAGLDFLVRLFFGVDASGNMRDGVIIAIQFFFSDSSFPGQVEGGRILGVFMGTIELIIFITLLNTLKTETLSETSDDIKRGLTITSLLTWIVRIILMRTNVLNKPSAEEIESSTIKGEDTINAIVKDVLGSVSLQESAHRAEETRVAKRIEETRVAKRIEDSLEEDKREVVNNLRQESENKLVTPAEQLEIIMSQLESGKELGRDIDPELFRQLIIAESEALNYDYSV